MTYRVEVVEGNMHEAVHGGTEPGLEGGRRIHITYISNTEHSDEMFGRLEDEAWKCGPYISTRN